MTTTKGIAWHRLLLLLSLGLMLELIFGLVSRTELATAMEIPTLSKRINDHAAMLSPATKQQLESVLAALEQEDSTQLAVLTVNSLEGANLEEFSLQVAEKWQLGQKGLDNGALLVIAKEDRKLRIEVGYGLEGVLTDLTCGRIIRDVITPQFRNGNFNQGVTDGVSAMISAVQGEFNGQDVVSSGKMSNSDLSGFLIFLFFALFNIGKMLGRNKLMAATIGAIIAPVIGNLFLGFQWPVLLIFIPAGFISAYLASLILGNISSTGNRSSGFRRHSSGGFGGGGGGGFSGGGGGFGGGGSSGGW